MLVPKLNTEEWYLQRDMFEAYIEDEVNPARLAEGLSLIRKHEARECYRILYEFWSKFNNSRLK
jgi:hypothetical protein